VQEKKKKRSDNAIKVIATHEIPTITTLVEGVGKNG
jgi:hypothetical protein